MVHRINYSAPTIVDFNERSITFQVEEYIKANIGYDFKVDKEVVLLQEEDGEWRILLETIYNTEVIKKRSRVQRMPPSPPTGSG